MRQDSDIEETVLRRIAALPPFAGRALRTWRIEPLGGLTNRNLKLTRDGERYAVRLPGAGTERYIDRAVEAHNAAIAESIGLSPEILYLDPADGTMVTRFVENAVPLDAAALRNRLMLRAVAETLGRLHRSGRRFRGEMRLFPKLDEYLELARGVDQALLDDLASARATAEPVRAVLAKGSEPLVPCHIDPAPHNFLAALRARSGTFEPRRVYLLDWEYAAMSEPMWDLAGLSIEGDLDADQDALMLEVHDGAASTALMGRLALYKVGLDLLSAAWAAVQIADGNRNADFHAFALHRLGRFRARVQDRSFVRHLAAAGG